jgi:hypothetical protein
MPIAMLVNDPTGSQEIHERVRERLGSERPAAGVLPVAGPSPKGGWRVIEVFDSEEEASASPRSDPGRPSRRSEHHPHRHQSCGRRTPT